MLRIIFQQGIRLLGFCLLLTGMAGTGHAGEEQVQGNKTGPVAPVGLQAFAKGDVFVGATQLNNPDDDHAGRGRILQYDADLNLKGVLCG